MHRRTIQFLSAGETLEGELVLPDTPAPYLAALLIGGTISDTRDGDPAPEFVGKPVTHGMLRVVAEHLAAAGIASLRWDKRGVGGSTGPNRQDYTDTLDDTDDAEQALYTLAQTPGIDPRRIAVLGESAGAHVACLLALRSDLPSAYVMQGALYDSIPNMIAFNYGRIHDYCARGPEAEAWVKEIAPRAYLMGLHWREVIAATERGERVYHAGQGDAEIKTTLRRLRSDLHYPPADQFRHLKKPTLVIQGERDMNVPPDNCYKVAKTMIESGNDNVTLVVVPRADHSMQLSPDDFETRLRERISFESFQNPYSQFFLHALVGWLLDTLREA